jgi:hypothetical protein
MFLFKIAMQRVSLWYFHVYTITLIGLCPLFFYIPAFFLDIGSVELFRSYDWIDRQTIAIPRADFCNNLQRVLWTAGYEKPRFWEIGKSLGLFRWIYILVEVQFVLATPVRSLVVKNRVEGADFSRGRLGRKDFLCVSFSLCLCVCVCVCVCVREHAYLKFWSVEKVEDAGKILVLFLARSSVGCKMAATS